MCHGSLNGDSSSLIRYQPSQNKTHLRQSKTVALFGMQLSHTRATSRLEVTEIEASLNQILAFGAQQNCEALFS